MRRLTFLVLALLLLGTVPSQAFFQWRGGAPASGGGGGTVVETHSWRNVGSSTVPGTFTMLQGGVPFAEGAVPAGSIPQPSIGGANLAQWQCDNTTYWSDGSMRLCDFSGVDPTALAAGASVQVVFTSATGSLPATLPGGAGVASITGNSDFNVAQTGVSNIWVVSDGGPSVGPLPPVTEVGLQLASNGTISSGDIRLLPVEAYTCAQFTGCGSTYTVQGCTGSTLPAITLNQTSNIPTSVNVTQAGSTGGCAYIGSGNFEFDANAILSGIASIPQCASNTNAQACIYAQGDTKLGIRVFGYYYDTATTAWAQNTAYVSGNLRFANGDVYKETSATCTSATSGNGPTGLIGTITDGSCAWVAAADSATTSVTAAPVAAVAYLEAWFTPSGSVYAVKGMIGSGTNIYYPGFTMKSVTANTTDFRSGSTEIRGSADGSGTAYGFSGLTTNAAGAQWWTADPNSNPYWWQPGSGTTNSAAFADVIPDMTAGDEVYWDASGVEMPIDRSVSPTTKTITIGPPGSSENATTNTCTYLPYSFCGVDTTTGIPGGGTHAWDALYSVFDSTHDLVQTISSGSGGDYGASLLTGVRSAALGWLGSYAGLHEADTWHPPNVIPSSYSSFTPPAAFIDPPRPNASLQYNTIVGDMVYAPKLNYVYTDNAHNPEVQSTLYAYLTQGERWVLDGLDEDATTSIAIFSTAAYTRGTVIGSTSFPASNDAAQFRSNVWFTYTQAAAAVFLPPGEPEDVYQREIVKEQYGLMDAGMHTPSASICIGNSCGGLSGTTSAYDLRPAGAVIYPADQIGPQSTSNGMSGFMSQYQVGVDIQDDAWLGSDIPMISTVANYEVNNFEVPNGANCPYVIMSYTLPTMINEVNRQPLASWDATNLTSTSRPVPQFGDGGGFQTYAGDPEVDLSVADPGGTQEGSGSFTVSSVTDSTHFTPSSTAGLSPGEILYDHTQTSVISSAASISGTALTVPVGGVTSGAIGVGDDLNTTATGGAISPTIVLSQSSGTTGQDGTYVLSTSHTLSGTALGTWDAPSSVAKLIPSHTWVTAITAGVVATNNPTSLIATDKVWFSNVNTYPYQNPLAGLGPTASQPPMPSGTQVWLMNFESPNEAWPYGPWRTTPASYFPPSPFVEGTPYIFIPDNAYSTEGHLTLSGSTVTPTTTGAWSWGFNYNAACPTENLSNGIYSMNFSGDPPSDALSMYLGDLKAWQALGHGSSGLTAEINALTTWTQFPSLFNQKPYWALAGSL